MSVSVWLRWRPLWASKFDTHQGSKVCNISPWVYGWLKARFLRQITLEFHRPTMSCTRLDRTGRKGDHSTAERPEECPFNRREKRKSMPETTSFSSIAMAERGCLVKQSESDF